MTKLIPVLLVAAALSACHRQAPAPAGQLPDDLVQPYVKIQEGLAKDSLDGLPVNAGAVSAAARRLGPAASAVDAGAQKLQGAATLADARAGFGALSEALVSYTKAEKKSLPADIRQAWCPMAEKPWLQRGSMIANPYYGKEMPTCGEFK